MPIFYLPPQPQQRRPEILVVVSSPYIESLTASIAPSAPGAQITGVSIALTGIAATASSGTMSVAGQTIVALTGATVTASSGVLTSAQAVSIALIGLIV